MYIVKLEEGVWLAEGTRPVPVGVWADIKQLAEQRRTEIDSLISKL